MTATTMLKVEAVTRQFGGFKAVDGVSLQLNAGEILGIAGTNGAGKSTLFAAIAGQQPADAGQIQFEGQDITRMPPYRRARLGLVRTFQIPREFKSLTVHENLMAAAANPQGERLVNAFFQTRSLREHEAQLSAKADRILQFLNLARVRDATAGGLSGGQKKLVELGRVLMLDPRCILLDEPFAGVNPVLIEEICDRVRELNGQGIAFIVIEHHLQALKSLSNRMIVMGSYLPDTTILREWFQSGADTKWIIPGWAANPDLVKALGAEVCEGIISVDTVSNEKSASYAQFDAAFTKATGKAASTNIYAAMAYDMVISLALAMEAAGPKATVEQINAKMRDVSNAPGTAVFTFAEGKAQLAKKAKVNYEGASSKLDFDKAGDVTPDFGVFIIEKGQLVRRDVVSISM
jgi:branched-chain amino acid transport system ATP-binding protein